METVTIVIEDGVHSHSVPISVNNHVLNVPVGVPAEVPAEIIPALRDSSLKFRVIDADEESESAPVEQEINQNASPPAAPELPANEAKPPRKPRKAKVKHEIDQAG